MDKLRKIKSLNQRLAEMEKKGLDHTSAYMNMVSAINPKWEATSRDGHIRISRSKNTINDLTSDDLDFLESKIGGLGELSRKFKLKGKALYKRLIDITVLTDFMQRNDALPQLYINAKRGKTKQEIASAEFIDMVKNDGGLSKYSYDCIFKKIEETGVPLFSDSNKPDINGVDN